MRAWIPRICALLVVVFGVSCHCGGKRGGPGAISVRAPLPRFASDRDLAHYLDAKAGELNRRERGLRHMAKESAAPSASQAPAGEPAADASKAEDGESITNTQEAGVDEGGIVKTHGDHLVILRRGRLFSVDLGGGQRRAVSRVDLGAEGSSWYDEMLLHGDTIIVVGYSYQSGGTELVFFHIDGDAVITPRGRRWLRSNDYYSSRNYASRLIGDRLIFYMPYMLFTYDYQRGEPRYTPSLPAVRQTEKGEWQSITMGTDVYKPIQPTDYPVLHTVVTCDLSSSAIPCHARGIIGPPGRTFYVSGQAVYVWVHGGDAGVGDEEARGPLAQKLPPAAVYRLPLDAGEPSVLRVAGAPIDQFSFQEREGHLNVLVRSEGGGDWMWAPEATGGDLALLRAPLAWFSEGIYTVPRAAYTRLPAPQGWSLQNRFVGDHVLYGTGGGWYGPGEGAERRVYVHPVAGGETAMIDLPHGVDRLEPMARDAVVIGSDGKSLHFTSVALGARPAVVDRFVQEGATQGETRSHGFFYKPSGDDEGVLGLPVRRGDAEGWNHLVAGSAQVLFLRVTGARFARLGALASDPKANVDDHCVVSCVDWYGNARPIFYRGRVFALLGYELVEGRLEQRSITELGRTSFLQPGAAQIIAR